MGTFYGGIYAGQTLKEQTESGDGRSEAGGIREEGLHMVVVLKEFANIRCFFWVFLLAFIYTG